MLRGFTAFDTFLQQHPEFRERVTFIAHLQPSRTDVPEYAEYLERIEALVAVVNHRHGTTDWMPIDLRIYENFPEAVARYKHFDLLIVNSLFDGMNLVAKEAPAVNTRDGVVMLSENTGAHEELGDCTLSVNPFDIQEQADTIYRALTMDAEERALRATRPERDRPRARPGGLDRRAARPTSGPSGRRTRRRRPRPWAFSADDGCAFRPGGSRLVRVAALLGDQRSEAVGASAGGRAEPVSGSIDPAGSGEPASQVEPAVAGPSLDLDPARLAPRARQPDLEAHPGSVSDRVPGTKAKGGPRRNLEPEVSLDRAGRAGPVGHPDLTARAGRDRGLKSPALAGPGVATTRSTAPASIVRVATQTRAPATPRPRWSRRRPLTVARRRLRRSEARSVSPASSETGQRLSTRTRRRAQARLAAVVAA